MIASNLVLVPSHDDSVHAPVDDQVRIHPVPLRSLIERNPDGLRSANAVAHDPVLFQCGSGFPVEVDPDFADGVDVVAPNGVVGKDRRVVGEQGDPVRRGAQDRVLGHVMVVLSPVAHGGDGNSMRPLTSLSNSRKIVGDVMKNPLPLAFLLFFAITVFVGGCTLTEKATNPEVPAISDLRKMVQDYLKAGDRPDHLFTIEPGRAALVLIDMQKFACSPTHGSPFPGIATVIRNINRLAAECRKQRIPVIWVRQNITLDAKGHNAGLYSRFHKPSGLKDMANLGEGTEIGEGLLYDVNSDYEVFKNRYSAFLSRPPELENLLERLGRDQLIIGGVAANVCVESTLRDAMQLDYEVILVSDATTSFDAVLLEATLVNTQLFFGDVRNTGEVLKDLGR